RSAGSCSWGTVEIIAGSGSVNDPPPIGVTQRYDLISGTSCARGSRAGRAPSDRARQGNGPPTLPHRRTRSTGNPDRPSVDRSRDRGEPPPQPAAPDHDGRPHAAALQIGPP